MRIETISKIRYVQQRSEVKLPRLISVPASHYAEIVRWALERLNINYFEESHVPLFYQLITRKNGGGKAIPVLVTEAAGTFTEATNILQYLDVLAPSHAKLYPTDSKLRLEVENLEHWFSKQLGPCVARWAYFYLLNDYKLMKRLWCEGTPVIEQALFPIIFPLISAKFRQRLNITPESVASAYEQVRSIFEVVSKRLADGCNYLVGDSFSAADLTFAALAAPAVVAESYRGVMLAQLHEVPFQMAVDIQQLQKTPAGIYAMRLFSKERGSVQ
jgi:glutathione S-transferase